MCCFVHLYLLSSIVVVAQSDDKDGAAMPSGASSDNLKTSYLQLLQEAFALREKLKGRQASAQLELERLHGPNRCVCECICVCVCVCVCV
jgi:hypothetical protein